MNIAVRAPHPEDAARMAEVHIAAWRDAYEGIMPSDFLADLDPTRFTSGWTASINEPGEGVRHLVGEIDGAVHAFATVGPLRGRDAADDPSGELWAINAHPVAFGTGVGSTLHRHALDHLRSSGHHRAALWVAERNARARRFYQREGWTLDEARKEEAFGDHTIVEVRYIISL